MKKSDLVRKVAERCDGVSSRDAELVVNTLFSSMTEALGNGERIDIRGFGNFEVRERKAKEGRNPKTGEKIKVKAKRVPFFKPGRDLKERVND